MTHHQRQPHAKIPAPEHPWTKQCARSICTATEIAQYEAAVDKAKGPGIPRHPPPTASTRDRAVPDEKTAEQLSPPPHSITEDDRLLRPKKRHDAHPIRSLGPGVAMAAGTDRDPPTTNDGQTDRRTSTQTQRTFRGPTDAIGIRNPLQGHTIQTAMRREHALLFSVGRATSAAVSARTWPATGSASETAKGKTTTTSSEGTSQTRF